MTESTAERRLPAGLTPRLLSRIEAAIYCGVSPNQFDKTVAKAVPAIRLATQTLLWDVRAIDRWIDQLSGLSHGAERPRPMAERF